MANASPVSMGQTNVSDPQELISYYLAEFQNLPDIPLDSKDPLLGIRLLEEAIDRKKSWIYEAVRSNEFPRPIKIASQNFWLLSSINLWKRYRVELERLERAGFQVINGEVLS